MGCDLGLRLRLGSLKSAIVSKSAAAFLGLKCSYSVALCRLIGALAGRSAIRCRPLPISPRGNSYTLGKGNFVTIDQSITRWINLHAG